MNLKELGLDKPAPRPTAEYFRSVLTYNSSTGIFVWLKRTERNPEDRRWNARYAGKQAGSIHHEGYIVLQINHQSYPASHIAWLYMTGSWPKDQIDHINLNRADNHWENLREATQTQNSWNQSIQSNNSSGYTGVYWVTPNRKWRAEGVVNGRRKHLGYFHRFDDAVAARKAFEAQHFGEFAYQPNGAK